MHIESFDYFYQVAKTKSISKVAKNQHISQSALSQQIQKFEEALGVSLLERSNKGVSLTHSGEVVLKYAENIIKVYEKMLDDLDSSLEAASNVRIEANHSIVDYALPCTLYMIKEKYSYHNYELITGSSKGIVDNIANNICDVGFVYGKVDTSEVNAEKVGTNIIHLIANIDNPIPDEISLDELKNYPLITLNDRYEIKGILKDELLKIGRKYEDLNFVFETDSIEALKSSITRGHGLGFITQISIKEELYRKKFKVVKIKDVQMNLDVFMIKKKNISQTKAVDEFIEAFRKLGTNSFC